MTDPSITSADEQQLQHLSSSSSTVSQSPIQEDNNDNNIGADHSCSITNTATTSTTTSVRPQQHQYSNANASTIINPYKKQTTTNPTSTLDRDPNSYKRKQFIEKYRLQAVQTRNHHRRQQQQQQQRGGMSTSTLVAPSSKSALEVLRSNQQWRQLWRQNNDHPQHHHIIGNDSCNNNGEFAVRPRLFLFQRMIQSQLKQKSDPMPSQPQQQRQQQQGVWELGTGINEISGEGGSGKTQMCLSLCMTCALTPLLFPKTAGDNSSNSNDQPNYYTSIYITMGEGIPQSKIASRLHQMLHHRLPPTNNNNNPDDNGEVELILSRIWLLSLKNEDDFIEFIEIHLPNILKNQSHGINPQQQQDQQRHQQSLMPNKHYPTSERIGLIAFDGIANFFRFSDPLFQQYQSSSSSSNYNQQSSIFHQNRSCTLFQLSSALRKMSDVYDVPIVITNQVTTSIPSDDGLLKGPPPPPLSSMMGQRGNENQIVPALGLIWSNCVTTRFILHRKDGLMAKISTGGNSNDNGGGGESATENGNLNSNKKKGAAAATRMQRVRKACVLQSVCTPEESEVWYFIDAGAVVAVS